MRVDSTTQFTADAHAGKITKVYGLYNNSFNIRHHAGLPAGHPVMTQMVKVDEIKSMNKYFAYLCPSKCSSC